MFKSWVLFVFSFVYLSLLFLIAYIAERRERAGKSIVSNPYVYSLSLAVYCTSWTFYGSVGKAATSGFEFLTIYLGPTLVASLWWIILRKIINIAKMNKITTISDLIGSRYGNSLFLSALVTIVTVVGITPYLGLQIKAIMSTFTIMVGEERGAATAGWLITLALGIFAIIFGARKLDASERHEGLIFAIAFESLIKLVAFLAVGFFVTYGLFDGFGDIFSRIKGSAHGELLYLGTGTPVSFSEWTSLLFLSMMAVMFLPRQFHVAVVENSDQHHVAKAMWLFPLYLFLINVFVIPVAFGGLLLGGDPKTADSFVLTIPLRQGQQFLSLFVFIGGFSAATGMIIVESIALSNMVMNNLIMPTVYRFSEMKLFEVIYPIFIINIKRLVIMGCIALGYFFATSIGEFYTLVDIGLKSFEAVTIFAPAILLGLYWKRGNKLGATAGIVSGFAIWFYTLLMPALIKSGILEAQGIFSNVLQSTIFNPHALFGLGGMDKWSHSLFWGLFFNLLFYVGFSLLTRQSEEEERQALKFVDSYAFGIPEYTSTYSIEQIEEILAMYIGDKEAHAFVRSFLVNNGLSNETISRQDLIRLRNEAERILSGVLGTSIATIILEDKLTLTAQERGNLSQSIKQMADTLRLSRQELAEANRGLSYLKNFSENIIESAPVGIITVDSSLRIRYWNREMESLTQQKRETVADRKITDVLAWITQEMMLARDQHETIVKTPAHQSFKVNISPFKDPAGGHVVIIEDITEKMKMEEQLLQTSKLAGLGKLTAGISHEIGNPLASISSLVQELRSLNQGECEDGLFLHESLTTINSHIDRIAKIVRSLGDFSRVSTSDKMLCSIPDILERTLNLVKYDKRFRNIQFRTKISEIPDMYINPDKMQQVFLNIMLNALDAMPDGGSLSIAIERVGTAVEIRFSDTGAGIDREIQDRIFDPFFTTKPLGRGTGLGLSICYGIIKEHHGSISVNSAPHEGAAFTISIPVMG